MKTLPTWYNVYGNVKLKGEGEGWFRKYLPVQRMSVLFVRMNVVNIRRVLLPYEWLTFNCLDAF